jgi:hypothetical protein
MAEHEFSTSMGDFPVSNAQTDTWRFLAVEKAMNRAKDFEEAHDFLLANLRAGEFRTLKLWRLAVRYSIIGLLLIVTIAALLFECWALFHSLPQIAWTAWVLGWVAVGLLILALAFR